MEKYEPRVVELKGAKEDFLAYSIQILCFKYKEIQGYSNTLGRALRQPLAVCYMIDVDF